MAGFSGLTVLVTGATGGFGRRAAERFAAEGARLVLSDLDPARLEETASAIDAETAVLAGNIIESTYMNGTTIRLDGAARLAAK